MGSCRHTPSVAPSPPRGDTVLQRHDAGANRDLTPSGCTSARSIWSGRRPRRSGLTQALYPVPQELKAEIIPALLKLKTGGGAGVHPHQACANRLKAYLVKQGIKADARSTATLQAHGPTRWRGQGLPIPRYSWPPTSRLAVIDARSWATSEVPTCPPLRRTTSTGRQHRAAAEQTGDSVHLVSPRRAGACAGSSAPSGRKLPASSARFDDTARTETKLEIRWPSARADPAKEGGGPGAPKERRRGARRTGRRPGQGRRVRGRTGRAAAPASGPGRGGLAGGGRSGGGRPGGEWRSGGRPAARGGR